MLTLIMYFIIGSIVISVGTALIGLIAGLIILHNEKKAQGIVPAVVEVKQSDNTIQW